MPEGEKGIVSIYDVISSRPMQSLPDAPDQSKLFASREMVCSAFSLLKEEILVTLTGAPDWQILLWDWNKKRLLHNLALGLTIPQQVANCNFQLSFNPFDREGHSILLTGPANTYKYIKKDIDNIMQTSLTQLISQDQARKISQNFTCHAWSQQTGHIIICTDNGEIVVCRNEGQYHAFILDAPIGNPIEAVTAISTGFLVAVGQTFYIYRTSDVDTRVPIKLHGERCTITINNEPVHSMNACSIRSMAVNQAEDFIFVTTNQG